MQSPEPDFSSQINLDRLKDFAETPAEQREFIELYLTETTRHLGEMKSALLKNDAATLRRVAHTAAGASATCGMDGIVPLFRKLEYRGEEGNLEGVMEFWQQATAEFDKLEKSLRQYLQSL